MSYQETLSKSILTPAQAEVYEALLMHGAEPAGSLAKKTTLKRGLVYKVLDELVGMGLVEKGEEVGKVARFTPKHPSLLRELVESRQKALKDAELSLESVLPSLISSFNLVSGAPGIEIYEGPEGIEKVLNDSLSSKTVIYTYADIEAVRKNIDAINRRYMAKREKLGIEKKLFLFDSAISREYMGKLAPSVTDTKLIPSDKGFPMLESAMEIYDGSVAYVTFSKDKMIGVIIHDPFLYELHKHIFEYMWGKAPGPAELSGHKPKKGSVKTTAGTVVAETADEASGPETASGPKPFEVEDYDDDEYFVRL
ncbi:MAG: helix-turn-helix domain-containing protein [Candidatus Moraniibacteriota bacterium]